MTLFLKSKVKKAPLICLKPFIYSDEIALFVTFAPHGIIKPHVQYYLRSLRKQKIAIILIIAANQPNIEIDADIIRETNGVFVRQNSGFDFAAWAHIFYEYPQLYNAKTLYLLNDSIIGPTNDDLFKKLITRIRQSSASFIGLTDNFNEYRSPRHFQSYFLVMKAPALSSHIFQKFIRRIVPYKNKNKTIVNYETQLTRYLEHGGIHCDVIFPSKTMYDPTLFHWRTLLDDGFPFLKVSVIQDRLPLIVDNRGWQFHIAKHGYDLSLVSNAHTFKNPKLNDDVKNLSAKSSIAVYQIFYKKRQQYFLEDPFIPYDNSDSFAPMLCEYGVFKKIFEALLHKQYEYVGAVSWKFKRKTALSGEHFFNYIKKNPGYDVYFVNPFPRETIHRSVWTQGDLHHSGITELAQSILIQLKYDIDLFSIQNDINNTAYCNYWVGNELFWEKYMAFTLPIYYYILYESPLYLRDILLKKRADKKINAPYFPFLFERLFSTLLVVDPSIKYLRLLP
ncbi:Rhamnan synthesis protein F [Legionella sainthelensi]|uniref:rhamnan synthesis F family protein n=1 Tax=Legionella sainthelensi TaxID=28087 RepID=UPI000E2091A8|nr:rhamnan synthesis F family protein [Legionella sainthelensi]VEB32318.1 Rhamnan synthesis protein F [Legionella sainthelensi]